jgi:hypothetical protein
LNRIGSQQTPDTQARGVDTRRSARADHNESKLVSAETYAVEHVQQDNYFKTKFAFEKHRRRLLHDGIERRDGANRGTPINPDHELRLSL